MPPPFRRTAAALGGESSRLRLSAFAIAVALAGAWAWWFAMARVTIYATSEDARLEIDRAPHPVEATVGGRVIETAITVGQAVKRGDTLIALDPQAQSLQVGEARTRVSGLRPQLDRVHAEVAERQRAREQARAAAAAARAEAQARYDEARAAADLADDNERRLTRLFEDRLIPEADLTRARSEAKQRRAAAETLRLTIVRLAAEEKRTDTGEQIEIARLQREAADLQAQIGTGAAEIERLQHEGRLRRIEAPVDGTLAEVAPIRAGSVLPPGARVATILPVGTLRVVAHFRPADAFGRVRPDQPARLRLDGFPWTTYGSVQTRVSSVAAEVRDGLVRVELDVVRNNTSGVPLQHGLPGAAEVEVERVSPVTLVLRAAGRRISPPVRPASERHPQ